MLQLAGPTPVRAGQKIDFQPLPFSGLSLTGQDMSFTLQHSRTDSIMMLSAQGEAAEFSQVRPDADALMQLPATEWLTNGGDLYNRNFLRLIRLTPQRRSTGACLADTPKWFRSGSEILG